MVGKVRKIPVSACACGLKTNITHCYKCWFFLLLRQMITAETQMPH